jgi:hypothetical protein
MVLLNLTTSVPGKKPLPKMVTESPTEPKVGLKEEILARAAGRNPRKSRVLTARRYTAFVFINVHRQFATLHRDYSFPGLH